MQIGIISDMVQEMTVDELIEAAKTRRVTDTEIEAFRKRLEETRVEFEEMESSLVTKEFLDREYTI
jgi:hypothetical protein